MPPIDPPSKKPADEDERRALSLAEKREKRLEFARKRMLDPGPDPALFPRGAMLLPWLVMVVLMPVVVGIGGPLWADAERKAERRKRNAQSPPAYGQRFSPNISPRVRSSNAYQTGQNHFDNREFRAAIDQFDEAIDADAGNTNAYWLRALSQFEIQDLQSARDDLDTVIRLNPNHAYAHRSRGQVRALLGDRDGAILDFLRAHDLDPSSAYPALWVAGLDGGVERLKPFASGSQWINEVARYYLDRMTDEELIQRANQARDESERQDQLCEAYGYIGLRLERDGQHDEAMQRYRQCVATGVTNFIEYRWASVRLNQEGRRMSGSDLELERE